MTEEEEKQEQENIQMDLTPLSPKSPPHPVSPPAPLSPSAPSPPKPSPLKDTQPFEAISTQAQPIEEQRVEPTQTEDKEDKVATPKQKEQKDDVSHPRSRGVLEPHLLGPPLEKIKIHLPTNSRLQKILVQLLEDPAGELGLTNDWDAVHAAINLLVKRQKRIDKSIVVDSHEDFEENGIVEKIVEKPKASSSPTLEGKEKPKATQSSTLDDLTMDDLIKDENEEEVKASTNLWPHALQTAKAGKVTSFTLRQAGDSIRETMGWTDPVDSLSVYAYIAKAQANEAFVEDKRKREDEAPETSKRQTRANTWSDGERMQKSTPIPEVQMKDASKEKKQSKVRGPSYKLRSDIELATNLKKVFEEHILNSKVEMTLGDILGIAKREFHEEIIDIIKRKRHVPVEQETNPTNSQNILHEELEDLEEPRARMENDVVLEAKHAHFHEYGESDEVPRSHFLRSHWARATTETMVKIAHFEEPILTLVDHGSEINLMSMTLYQKGKWPIDLDHGWNTRCQHTTRYVPKVVKTTISAASSRTTRSTKKSSSDNERTDTDKDEDSDESNKEDSLKGAEAKGPSEHERSDEEDTSTPLDKKSKNPGTTKQVLMDKAMAKVEERKKVMEEAREAKEATKTLAQKMDAQEASNIRKDKGSPRRKEKA
ncbi:hypothetical protein L7F22_066064 [Adiantum nelumboides]|nr:hypothetical protein [Adiantum nelumboides]